MPHTEVSETKPPEESLPESKDDLSPKQISKELRGFFQFQREEITVKKEDIELQKQQDNHAFEVAVNATNKRFEDKKDERLKRLEESKDKREKDEYKHKRSCRYLFASLVVVALLLGYSMFLNQTQVAEKIIDKVAYIIVGGIGGYGLSEIRNRSREKDIIAQLLDSKSFQKSPP